MQLNSTDETQDHLWVRRLSSANKDALLCLFDVSLFPGMNYFTVARIAKSFLDNLHGCLLGSLTILEHLLNVAAESARVLSDSLMVEEEKGRAGGNAGK